MLPYWPEPTLLPKVRPFALVIVPLRVRVPPALKITPSAPLKLSGVEIVVLPPPVIRPPLVIVSRPAPLLVRTVVAVLILRA